MSKKSRQYPSKTALNLPTLTPAIRAQIAPFHFDYKSLNNPELSKFIINQVIIIRAKFFSKSLDESYLTQALNKVQERLDSMVYLNWLNTELIEPGYISQSFIQ